MTDHALAELAETFKYLQDNWTPKELHNLSVEVERTIKLISVNPDLFPKTKNKEIRRAVILRLNTLYYRKYEDTIEILSFFSNRRDPLKIKL